MSISKRLRRAAVGVAAIAALGVVVSTAGATPVYVNPFDDPANNPNTTNVPYLAWRGENLRLVKCWGTDDFNRVMRQEFPSLTSDVVTDQNIGNLFGSIVQTNVQLEDWSGADTGVNTPKEVINGARTFLYYNVRTLRPVICWQDTWASQKAGLGQFKLTVSIGLTNFDNTGVSFGAQVLVMQHQWLAGWMSLNAPTLDEVTSRDPAHNPEGLGDPKGDGNFFAGDNWVQQADGTWIYDSNAHPGEIRATVKGTLPLGQDFSELGLGASITLPDQWAALAGALATDADPTNATPAMRWDIHDEMVDENGNAVAAPVGSGVGGRSDPLHDAVVSLAAGGINPNGGPLTSNGDARFTRILTPTNLLAPASDFPTAGPFDPNYAEQTLLPDGHLDAGDAPMPAARIDFAIAANTNPLTSSDGVGSLVDLNKSKVYSQNDQGDNATRGNLFAPFYSQYIPATSRDPFGYASGVDGALITNNFPGFLFYGKVTNWTTYPLVTPTALKTNCRQRGDNYRYTPGGAQTVAVYTDEHGEARVGYLPGGKYGNDFYFDAINQTPNDSNLGCDLKGVRVLGTSHISAIARYPYQKVTDPDKPAKTTLVKTVYNLFDKHLSYYPKNSNYSSDNATLDKLIVAHAQDIQGKPFVGETVCFSGAYESSGAAISGFFPLIGWVTITKPDGTVLKIYNFGEVRNPLGSGFKCTKTDDNGNAVFELQGSPALTADVIANFTDEGLARHIDVAPGGGTVADNPPLSPAAILAGGSATTGPGSNGTGSPTASEIQSVIKAAIAGGFGVIATPAVTTNTNTINPKITATKTIKTRMLIMRLVRPAHGRPYFLVKVQSAHKTAKITISLKNSHGKTIGKITKTIATNKLVKIQSSLIKLSVHKGGVLSVK